MFHLPMMDPSTLIQSTLVVTPLTGEDVIGVIIKAISLSDTFRLESNDL